MPPPQCSCVTGARISARAGHDADFPRQVVQVLRRPAVIAGDDLVARAVVANGVAERQVHVQRQRRRRGTDVARQQRVNQLPGTEILAEPVRGRIRRIPRPRPSYLRSRPASNETAWPASSEGSPSAQRATGRQRQPCYRSIRRSNVLSWKLNKIKSSVLCRYAGHRLLHRRARRRKGLRVCQIRTARPIRRLWRVLHDQFDETPRALSRPVPRHCDTEVDPRCNAGTREPIAVDADALAAGLGAELGEGFPGTPVHRRAVASQQSSGPQQQGACADTAHPPGARPAISQKGDCGGIASRSNVGFAPPPTKSTSGSVQASSKLLVACTLRPQSVGTAPDRCQTY